MKELLDYVIKGCAIGTMVVFSCWAGIDNRETIKQTESLQIIAKQLEEN